MTSQTTWQENMAGIMTTANLSDVTSDTGSDTGSNVSSYTTESVAFGARHPAVDYSSLVLRLDICRRMSPPPIPPWLMEAPEKLRLLVANCSSWRRYTDLCSLYIPPDYPQALAARPGYVAVQWIPFIIVVLLVTTIIISVVVTYTLYRTNRMKCKFLGDYSTSASPRRNYCLPTGSITTSVTIETQLSVCALEDDYTLASMAPLHLSYTDRLHCIHDPRAERGGRREILLHPSDLQSSDSPEPCYVTDLSNSQYYSSQSLPILTDKGAPTKAHRRRLSSGSISIDSEEIDYSAPNYVHIQTGRLDSSRVLSPSRSDFLLGKNTVRGIIKRCQKAGVYIVHGVLGNKHSSSKDSGAAYSQVKPFPPFKKLRRSFKNMRLPNQRLFKNSKSLDHGMACQENLAISVEEKVECNTSTLPAGTSVPSSSLSTVLKRFGRTSNKTKRQSSQPIPETSHGLETTNSTFQVHTDQVTKVKKSPFQKLKVPHVLRNLTKKKRPNLI
uniref:Uncharacterized protein n=1 Tax=Biomphalaria glabrata TaxID=6526 RepID=A0A2C9M191_BIOGL